MLTEKSRRQFLIDGTHLEIFFIFNNDGLMNIVPVTGMDKDEIVTALKKLLSEQNAYAYIHIAETTNKMISTAEEADSLMLIAESRDGLSTAIISTVAKKGEEKLLLDAIQIDGKNIHGRFTGIFENGRVN